MVPAPHDMCLLYIYDVARHNKPASSRPCGMSCLQTDDMMMLGNDAFFAKELEHSRRFKSSPLESLLNGGSLTFNGAKLSRDGDRLTLTTADHIAKMYLVDTESVAREEYASQRARGGYIASICRPDLMFGFAYAAQFPDPGPKQAKELNKTIPKAIASPTKGLRFVPLELATMDMAIFIDASFAGNADLSSQLGFVTVLYDASGKCY